MTRLRTGIIGCGNFAHKHSQILSVRPEVELVAFCDNSADTANAFSRQYAQGKATAYTDFVRMYDEAKLDLVYICLPPYAHTNEVELACSHGVHFLLEKPIALTVEAARAMAAQVEKSQVKSQVGFMYRHGQAALSLKALMNQQEAGPRGLFTGRYACNSLHAPWWRNRVKSGGQLVEQIIHLVDITRFFFGEAVEVYSVQANLFHQDVPDYTVEDASATTIRFAGGGIAVLSATNGAIPNRWDYDWRIFLKGVTADFTDANHAVFHQTERDWPETITVSADKDVYLAETLNLIRAIEDDEDTAVPIEEGVKSLELALAATQSSVEGKPVSLIPKS
jgi:predicted dehydrogenase